MPSNTPSPAYYSKANTLGWQVTTSPHTYSTAQIIGTTASQKLTTRTSHPPDQSTKALIGTAVRQLTSTMAAHSKRLLELRAKSTQPLQTHDFASPDTNDYIYPDSSHAGSEDEAVKADHHHRSRQRIPSLHLTKKSHEQPHYIELRTRHRRPSLPQTTDRHFHRSLPQPLHQPPRPHSNTMVSLQWSHILCTGE